MTDLTHADAIPATNRPMETPAEVRAHRESFDTFVKLATFSALHVALVLACLALGVLGHAPGVAVLLGVGGTVAMVIAFLLYG